MTIYLRPTLIMWLLNKFCISFSHSPKTMVDDASDILS